MKYTPEDIDILESWWIEKSRRNFLAYRMFMRAGNFKRNWFVDDLSMRLQNFYVDYINGERPILLIQTPPQMGKSIAVADFIAWISGKIPDLKTIYATFSDTLGTRCNLSQQRQMDSSKYKKIFHGTNISSKRGEAIRNTKQLEFLDKDGKPTDGGFRNTTTGGPVTGETLSLACVDDAVKGREQANSITVSQKTWEWFTDDFSTRFTESAGLLIIMTRWTTHDIIGRVTDKIEQFKGKLTKVNYKAIATKDEKHRKEGEALFPALKSLDFLMGKKNLMLPASWESLYQGNPTVSGGDLIKDDWWGWWRGTTPPLKYKFIVADTAQKTKTHNDWTVLQCWGYGIDGRIYLLDKIRERMKSPTLRVEAEMFYNKHNLPKQKADDPILRGMYIEDKSSGSGLIQELQLLRLNITEVQRNTDKIFRCEDVANFIKTGLVVLSTEISGVDNLTKEAREFPNGEFDDDFDALMSAVEITYINKESNNSLRAAMEAA